MRGPGTRRATALAVALFVFGFGQELWFRYLPAYLRTLGASAFGLGLFGTLKDLLDAAYAYPGGVVSDRLGTRRALLLFGALSTAGFGILFLWSSDVAVFASLFFVMAWASLGLPATFSLVGEELEGDRRVVGFTVQAVLKRIPIVLAPPLGGLLLERYGMANGIRIGVGISIVLSIAMLVGLARALPSNSREPARASPQPVRLRPALKQLLIADCLIRLCEGLPDVFLVVWAIEVVRVSPAQFGMLISVLMATAIASYVPAAALAGRGEKKPFVLLTYVFFTLFPLAVLASRSFGHLLVAYALGGPRDRRARSQGADRGPVRTRGSRAVRRALLLDSRLRSGGSGRAWWRTLDDPPFADLSRGGWARDPRNAMGGPVLTVDSEVQGAFFMKWVTRPRIHVNRTATGWLIRRFLDPAAEILFVEPAEVSIVQERDGAIGFDAPGARHPHKDAMGRCSFEQLVAQRLPGDAALARLARIVHGADFPEELDVTPESAGLWAISQGFTDVGRDDADILNRAGFLYDSLYAHLRRQEGSRA